MCHEKPPNRRLPKIFVNSYVEIYIFLTYLKDSGYEVLIVCTSSDQLMEEGLEELQAGYSLSVACGEQRMECRRYYRHLLRSVEQGVLPFARQWPHISFGERIVDVISSVLAPCCKLLPIGVHVVDRLFHQLLPRRMPFFPQVLQAAVDVSEYPGGPAVLTGGLYIVGLELKVPVGLRQ